MTNGYFQTIARPTPEQIDKEHEKWKQNKKQLSAVPFVCILFALNTEIDYGND